MNRIEELKNKERYTVNDLLTIMEVLRSENGCPWDREQTHESIRQNFIEETYEVVEAIDTADVPELGDVLLQVVFHARISEEAGDFSFDDVADEVCRKLVVRHPHVFGDIQVENSGEVLVNWEKIKEETKKRETVTESLASVSRTLPSLMRAAKIAKKAKKGGYAKPLEETVGDMLFDICALCNESGIDPEKALFDACNRRIDEVDAKEKEVLS